MSVQFPTVGVIGETALVRLMRAPALALGVEIDDVLDNCSVVSVLGDAISATQARTFEHDGRTLRPNLSTMIFVDLWNQEHASAETSNSLISVLVARSPHGQACAWAPSTISLDRLATATPVPSLSPAKVGGLQELSLNLAKEAALIGVMEVEFEIREGEFHPRALSLGPNRNGTWTIEGARTSQFEQHLRAILDLPLGDPSVVAPFIVTGRYFGEGNMYRPYLHLMARSPGLKFHQYLSGPGQAKGHVTAIGRDLLELQECVNHAVDYMSGVIDE